ncbi:DUF58 domain-containing protein [Rugamonas sp. CCM 8940]|uniref:DUF58 domain-containing protein n=1 Tax=Rugamonas sp. CCM 8940 TaxID=2765359 RepID=UPI0018F52BD8|nr:DUF58 domain-containing protein [Rugamonas sp. CCM 8940]MBJ7308654.1 DUF58 domain-containing protein [Rugamonas sp. CCM 8940]
MFARLRQLVRNGADRWLFQLSTPEAGEVPLTMRRVFILPSGPGLAFGALLLVMFVGAVNYNLGLGHALTFLAGSCAVADMIMTARNLALLRLSPGHAAPVFAGEEAQFELRLHNRTRRDRYAVWLDVHGAAAPRQAVDVAAGAEANVLLSAPTTRRGWQHAPRLQLSTRFPLGLFRAWSYWHPALRVLVYPYPERDAPPLPTQGAASEDGHGQVGLDNFAGIRPYQPGDPMRHLAWRQIARHDPAQGGQLVSKQFDGGAVAELRLDFEQLPVRLDLELRLARLTSWVLLAERRALPYSLRLHGRTLGPALGQAHRAACLRALALYGLEDGE